MASYLTAIVFLAAMVFDLFYSIHATVFCVLWLALSLIISKTQGRDIKALVRRGKIMPSNGLPTNKRLHTFYTAALLVTFMLFFSLMIVMRELAMMLAFVSWLFVGFATLQDIGERQPPEQHVH